MTRYVCSSCGESSASWYGRCPSCKEWSTLKEFAPISKKSSRGVADVTVISPLKGMSSLSSTRIATHMPECDRVLGGGFISGEVILLGGAPGVGKSTLLLKMLDAIPTVYMSGEESGDQIKQRADRLGINTSAMYVSTSNEIQSILESLAVFDQPYDVVVIDSIQTMYAGTIQSPLGSVSHVKEVTSRLVEFAKRSGKIIVIIGHVTKDGDIAGPKTLEHLVDCVLYLEGDKQAHFRILRAQKNRFGPTDEVGIFAMTDKGLTEVDKPVELVSISGAQEPGRALVASVEGSRALYYEIQSLVVPTVLPVPRRVASGVDFNRLQLLLAVMRKHMKMKLDIFDIYVSVVGGLTAKTPSVDMGIVASIASSIDGIAMPKASVCIGEIGLLGEVRDVYGQEKVVTESARFGIKKVFSSSNVPNVKMLKKLLFRA